MLSCSGLKILDCYKSYNNAEIDIVGVTSIIIASKPRAAISGIITKNKVSLIKDYSYIITLEGCALSNSQFAFIYPGTEIKTVDRTYINMQFIDVYKYVFTSNKTQDVDIGVLFGRNKNSTSIELFSISIDINKECKDKIDAENHYGYSD